MSKGRLKQVHDRFSRWIRRTGPYLEQQMTHPWALARVALWTGLFLLVYEFAWPRTKELSPWARSVDPQTVTVVALNPGEPAGWISEVPERRVSALRIGWVSGSSTIVVGPHSGRITRRFIPVMAHDRLRADLLVQHTRVLMYAYNAGRIYDTHLGVLHALDHDADVVVVALNPIYLFTTKCMTVWTNLYADAAAQVLPRPGEWYFYGMVTTPTQWIKAGAAPVWPHMRNHHTSVRRTWRRATPKWFKRLQEPRRKEDDRLKPPYEDWIRAEREIIGLRPGGHMFLAWSQPERGGGCEAILRRLCDELIRSGKPTLIYLAPANPLLFQAPDRAAMHARVVAALKRIVEPYQSDRFHLWIPPREGFTEEMYRDYVHLKDPSRMMELIVPELRRTVLRPYLKQTPQDAASAGGQQP